MDFIHSDWLVVLAGLFAIVVFVFVITLQTREIKARREQVRQLRMTLSELLAEEL